MDLEELNNLSQKIQSLEDDIKACKSGTFELAGSSIT